MVVSKLPPKELKSEGLQIPCAAAGVLASSNSQSQPCCAWLLFFRPFLRQQAAAEVPQNKTGARYRMLLGVLSCGK